MTKVMIVGGAGYIGTLLSTELHERGYDVHVVDLMWFGNNTQYTKTTTKNNNKKQ